ncbi:MAG: hypothetical protein Q9227_005362 [Pyrenula ochraceoflavens]
MKPTDLHRLNLCNLDPLTENYDLGFYLQYLMQWPSFFLAMEDEGKIVGYSRNVPAFYLHEHKAETSVVMGKLETQPDAMRMSPHYTPWHGHITVLTVAPQHRRMGYAKKLTQALEQACNGQDAFFIDLYVRASNKLAIDMYKKMGYSVFRRVVDYYQDDPTGKSNKGEDAFDMRKPLDRDKKREHVRENGEEFRVHPEDVS